MSNSRSIDLIVADLGGTLVKTDEAILVAVRRAAGELEIPEGHADPVYDVFGTSIWECFHSIQAQNPDYLLDSFAGLCGIVRE